MKDLRDADTAIDDLLALSGACSVGNPREAWVMAQALDPERAREVAYAGALVFSGLVGPDGFQRLAGDLMRRRGAA